eukprot:CAMPEP_0198250186 /NCGR_PEP_ID=MMETSP1447-20131203/1473_1 /TAXON_ID=420782 /ORGANISM="Chaetoceros dichaeta, Strain CCMP1751" /LENGTH=153 /DNA_ID=CAMNT_0043934987 /DNA_START=88 /DNA_END=549 /DNA_ORIENTATION=-
MKAVSWGPNLPSAITKYHAEKVLKGNEKENSELDNRTIKKLYGENYVSTSTGTSKIMKGATKNTTRHDDIDLNSTFRAEDNFTGHYTERVFGSDEPLRKKKKMEHNNNDAVGTVLPMGEGVGVDGMGLDCVGGDVHFMDFLDNDIPSDTYDNV